MHAEIDQDDAVVLVDQEVSGMGIAVKEAVDEHLMEKRADHPEHEGNSRRFAVLPIDVLPKRLPFDVFHGENPLSGQIPMDLRNPDSLGELGIDLQVCRDGFRRTTFGLIVHLAQKGIANFGEDQAQVRNRDEVEEPESDPCTEKIDPHGVLDTGIQDLHRQFPPVDSGGSVHLAKTGRRHRLIAECGEALSPIGTQRVDELNLHLGEVSGGYPILETGKGFAHLLGKDVDPKARQLTQLDQRTFLSTGELDVVLGEGPKVLAAGPSEAVADIESNRRPEKTRKAQCAA